MSVSYPIILNKSNYAGGSTYIYRFGTSVEMGSVDIALGSAALFYSWRNITTVKANNTLTIIHPSTLLTNVTLNLVIPAGGYEIADINNFIKFYLITNGYYIQNSSTGEQTVFLELRVNPSTYQVEFVSYPLPTSLPAGYTAGSSIMFPTTARGPQLIVGSNPFGNLIGFEVGTFPSTQASTVTTVGSTKTPVLSDVQNVVITLDSASNPYAPNSKVIHSVSYAGVSYGRLITSEPNELSFVPQQQGFRQEIRIQLCDQNLRPLELIDSDVTIKLLLRAKLS